MDVQPEAKQQERARITRARIIDAAAVEFTTYGYAAASINTILATSGRTKGALYFHFKSKDAVGRAVFDEARARYSALALPWRATTDHPLTSLTGLMSEITSALVHEPILQAEIQLGIESECTFERTVRASLSWEVVALELATAADMLGSMRAPFTPERLVRSLATVIAGQRLLSLLIGNPAAAHAGYTEACATVIAAMTIDAAAVL